jgi:demethylmenaquinone methyltransferase/2-methoxy-6-polyprenyl-1,4-benzoquinol methylase
LGSGTGDMIHEILRIYPDSKVVGIDFTAEMIQIGRTRKELDSVWWIIADVQSLPFPPSTFDGTSSAFLMRNLHDVIPALKEQYRILRDEGQLVCLETTPPQRNLLYAFVRFYLNRFIPLLGGLISRDMDAYTYLANSTAHFLTPESLAEKLTLIGFRHVKFSRRMFGVIAIHTAEKSKPSASPARSE